MINIFVIHTPFHLLVVEQMVSTMAEFREARNFLLLELPCQLEYNSKIWDGAHYLHNIGGSVLGRANYLKAEENIRQIRHLINGGQVNRIFLSAKEVSVGVYWGF